MEAIHHKDLFGYLADQYVKSGSVGKTLEDFLSFARNHLRQFPPCEVSYVASGLGVRLTNGMRLAFTQDQLGTGVTESYAVPVIGSLGEGVDQRHGIDVMHQQSSAPVSRPPIIDTPPVPVTTHHVEASTALEELVNPPAYKTRRRR